MHGSNRKKRNGTTPEDLFVRPMPGNTVVRSSRGKGDSDKVSGVRNVQHPGSRTLRARHCPYNRNNICGPDCIAFAFAAVRQTGAIETIGGSGEYAWLREWPEIVPYCNRGKFVLGQFDKAERGEPKDGRAYIQIHTSWRLNYAIDAERK